MDNKLIVVLGMHRSGTSAITRGLQTMGVSLGDRLEPPARGINDKGYWEDFDIVELNEHMLGFVGHSWHSLEPIQQHNVDLLCKNGYLERAIELLNQKISALGFFGFKDPRTAKLLLFWERVFADGGFDAHYVIALRNPPSVVKSLTKRDDFEPEQGYLLWADHILSILANIGKRPAVTVDYDTLLQNPEKQLTRVADWLGADIDPVEASAFCGDFLSESLRHSLFTPDDVMRDDAAPPLVREIYTYLMDTIAGKEQITSIIGTEKLANWLEEHERLRQALRLSDRLYSYITERDAQLAERDAQLAERDAQLAERDAQLAERDAQLAVSTAQYKASENKLLELADTLAQLKASTSWRVMAPLLFASTQVKRAGRFLNLLSKTIQKRGGVAGIASKTIRVLREEGFAGIMLRLRLARRPHAMLLPIQSNPIPAADLLRVVPYYIDPLIDEAPLVEIETGTVAVHLHLFYEDMLEQLAAYLRNIPTGFDLYVSVKPQVDVQQTIDKLRQAIPLALNIVVEAVPNRGRDLAPLIVQFGERLSKYNIVGHVHTKKSPHNSRLAEWCEAILYHLFGPQDGGGGRVAHIFHLLDTQAKIVFPERPTGLLRDFNGWAGNHKLARKLLDKYSSLSIENFPIVEFPAGSMFWARGECLKDFLELPLRFEDFPLEPIQADGTLAHALERLILIMASPYAGQCIRLHQRDSVGVYSEYEDQLDYSAKIVDKDVRVLAYYLPQFNPIPENDEWHGKGFTEWTKVQAANPLFKGHYQQHIPHDDIGYYLLDTPETLRMQARLMQKAGVYGQIFYHYWFSGKLILEKPAQMLLANPDIVMPFCFCWANENWTKRWDGNEDEILLGQNYSPDDAREFIQYLIPFFRDKRYIRIEGRPVIFIYRPSSIPDAQQYLDIWKEECAAAGLAAPYVGAVLTREATHPGDYGMDAGVERVLYDWTNGNIPNINDYLEKYQPINGHVYPYQDVAEYYMSQDGGKDFTYFRSLVPMWDNTARYGTDAYLLHGSTPERFQVWLESVIRYTKTTLPADRRFLLINAWNEWAEGAHLEPDSRYGYAYLNSVGRALAGIPYKAPLDIVFDHNIGGGTNIFTEQLLLHLFEMNKNVGRIYHNIHHDSLVLDIRNTFTSATFEFTTLDSLVRHLKQYNIDKIHINSLINFKNLKALIDCIGSLKHMYGSEILYYVHDFYHICPSQHLLNFRQEYCFVPNDLSKCNLCFKKNQNIEINMSCDISLPEWRNAFRKLFDSCDKIIFFNRTGADISRRAYDLEDDQISIKPHSSNQVLQPVQAVAGSSMHIGILGNVNWAKGANIINKLAHYIAKEKLPAKITVIGTAFAPLAKNINITGAYEISELPSKVVDTGVNVIFLSSIVPETFSFTFSEVMQMKLPVLAYDLGAQGDRIANYDKGYLVSPNTHISKVYQMLEDIWRDNYNVPNENLPTITKNRAAF